MLSKRNEGKTPKIMCYYKNGIGFKKKVRDTSIKEDKIHLMSLTVTSWKT